MSADTIRSNALREIDDEREYQQGKWGNAFDDQNTINDWTTYICRYASNAAFEAKTAGERRTQLIKVAALACAAVETIDRIGDTARRHYD